MEEYITLGIIFASAVGVAFCVCIWGCWAIVKDGFEDIIIAPILCGIAMVVVICMGIPIKTVTTNLYVNDVSRTKSHLVIEYIEDDEIKIITSDNVNLYNSSNHVVVLESSHTSIGFKSVYTTTIKLN